MFASHFQFTLTITNDAGFPVHREEVHDFAPLYEDLLFRAVLEGAVPNDGSLPPASLAPIFGPGGGSQVVGLLASLSSLKRTYGLGLLAARVQELQVERSQGDSGKARARLTWHVGANELAHQGQPPRLRSSRHRRPYPFVRDSRWLPEATGRTREGEPVSLSIRRSVLETLREEAARHLEVERANILVGHLVQEGPGTAAVVVTGHSPVELGANASRVHCDFTPETFLALHREIRCRADGAVILGWAHTHPPVCGAACLQHVPACETGMLFFSIPDDHAVHRAAFPARYMVALVSGKEPGRRADEPGVRAYGWKDGGIAERQFQVFA
jgi:hypothetical protein